MFSQKKRGSSLSLELSAIFIAQILRIVRILIAVATQRYAETRIIHGKKEDIGEYKSPFAAMLSNLSSSITPFFLPFTNTAISLTAL